MASSELPFGIDRSRLRLDGKDPYLCLHFVIIFVRDQERSLRFFVDKLGFRVMVDHIFEDGNRWIEVAPPDGTAQLGIALAPGSEPEKFIGALTDIYFITEDLPKKYKEWSERGVHFQFPPEAPRWGGVHTRFEDPDGNSFGLVGFDELTRGVETHRRALAQKLEAERRAAQELEIAQQVQSRLFPQVHPETRTLEYAGLCLPARQVGGDYYDFLDLGEHRSGQRLRLAFLRRLRRPHPASALCQLRTLVRPGSARRWNGPETRVQRNSPRPVPAVGLFSRKMHPLSGRPARSLHRRHHRSLQRCRRGVRRAISDRALAPAS